LTEASEACYNSRIMHTLACIVNMNRAVKPRDAARGLEPTVFPEGGLKMRSLAEIVTANLEAAKLGIQTAYKPVGVADVKPGFLTPERLRQLGLDKY
jgi:hypothetical protein